MKSFAALVVGLLLGSALAFAQAGPAPFASSNTAINSGTNTGDVTLGTANGLSLSGQALSFGTADAGVAGNFSLGRNQAAAILTLAGQTCTATTASNLIACGGILSAGQLDTTDYVTSVHLTGTYVRLAPATLDTCAAGTQNIKQTDATGGTGGKQSKNNCTCVVKNDGTTYAWINPNNTVASGHRYGTTTTCPDTDE